MPYEFFGKTTFQRGKTLWEILGNLRNHGVGRIVARNQFEKNHPAPSWYRVIEVQTLAPEGKIEVCPPVLDLGEVRRVRVLVDNVFRGNYMGREWLAYTTYKPDYKLIPKEDEEKYTLVKKGELPERKQLTEIFPSHCSFPPLLREIVTRDLKASGRCTNEEPKMKLQYATKLRIAQEGEEATVNITPSILPGTEHPSLYSTVKIKELGG